MINAVKWYFNSRCNLRCSFCVMDDRSAEELSFEEKCSVLDKMYEEGVSCVDFFGKEPLINTEAFDLMTYADSRGYDFNYSMITNGKNLVKYCDLINKSSLGQIAISYDFGADRDFTIDLNDLKKLNKELWVELSIDVQANTDFLLKSLFSVDFREYGVDSIYFKPIIPLGARSKSVIETQEKDYIKFCNSVLGMENIPNPTFSVPYTFKDLTKRGETHPNFFTDNTCSAGKGFIYIDCDGKAYGCGYQCANSSEMSVGYLDTPMEVIEELYRDNKKRLCVR